MVVVCGEALVDVVEAAWDEPRLSLGGGPFNTARGLARLGVPAAFLGRLSQDAAGRELAAALRADGVSLDLASFGPEPTPVALAEPDGEGGTRYRFTVGGTAAANLTPDLVPRELGPAVTALHLGTLGLVLEPMASTLLTLVERERGRRLIMVDPNVRPGLIDDRAYRERLWRVLELSDVVKASAGDLEWLFPGVEQAAIAEQLLSRGVMLVVITLGPDGAYAANPRAQVQVPAPAVPVVDTIGAGDAFGAALLAWLHDHQALAGAASLDADQLRSLLGFACRAAAITCTRAGALPPWRWELAAR